MLFELTVSFARDKKQTNFAVTSFGGKIFPIERTVKYNF